MDATTKAVSSPGCGRHDEIGRSSKSVDLMRNILFVVAIMAGLGTFLAQMADKWTPAPAAATASTGPAAAVETTVQDSSHSLRITRDMRGHFATEGRISGQRIGFMVDTGASVVALNETSAARFGLRPPPGQYTMNVTTANGTVKGARARLDALDVGGLVVRDVEALVLPDEALSENLLGLSFLSRLKRFEYADGQLVLQQ
jgi:aspartyl protease family protein